MPIGTICLFNDIIGKGTIEPDDHSGRKVVVSYRDIKKDGYKILYEGQRVSYDIIETPKGPSAINVTLL